VNGRVPTVGKQEEAIAGLKKLRLQERETGNGVATVLTGSLV
jgi:hypothetical protein